MPPKAAAKSKAKVISSSLPCRYFGSAKGCQFGESCAYKHNDPLAVAPCRNFVAGTCTFGDKCFFRHADTDKPQTEKPKGKGKGKGKSED
mmetsp:Transcript_96360/g.167321  ORF Transcript_96360/g.167321 Transcript_96360/m.167321 type:complete len:90 (+) Transcript_96360:90-359(+)